MHINDFQVASVEDRERFIIRPYENTPTTTLVPGSESHLVYGENLTISFLTMKAGSIFDIHSHEEEQIMIVVEGYCDEIIDGKIYRVGQGDVIHLPSGVPHGAFIQDLDCKAIDIFSPPRPDYARKFHDQNRGVTLPFSHIRK